MCIYIYNTHVHSHMDFGDFRDIFFFSEPFEGLIHVCLPCQVMPSFDPRPSAKRTTGGLNGTGPWNSKDLEVGKYEKMKHHPTFGEIISNT